MDEDNKLPLKRVEISLTKFNEVAIPHHLDLLRQHKTNILKYEEAGEWSRARTEQINARRVASQLKGLLRELEALRGRVRQQDLPRFDQLTQHARDTTLRSIVDYLSTSPLSINRAPLQSDVAASAVSTDSVGVVAHVTREAHGDEAAREAEAPLVQIELRVDPQEASLYEREELLRGWSELQAEVRALHDVWQSAQAAALAQREHGARTERAVEVAAERVSEARHQLAIAERLSGGAWGVGGACVGALVGGPVGLAAGAKAGALLAAAGSLLGYTAATLLGRRSRPKDD